MVYRKTAKVVAGLSARRALFIASSIDVISRDGIEALSVNTIAARADVSKGLLYQYFPDMAELRAAVVADLLAGDLAAVRAVAEDGDPLERLTAAIVVFYGRLGSANLAQFRFASPGHFAPMRKEMGAMINAAAPLAPKARLQAASAALGAIYGIHALSDGSNFDASAAILFVLRAVGVSEAKARLMAA
jgi:AcrR family transcriptional regulator